jgi:hypothetical protein
MAQSNFLMIILGVIVAGTAVLYAITGFIENRNKAKIDFMVTGTREVAAEAQRWMRKPEFFGGGGDNCVRTGCDWSNASLDKLGYKDNDDDGAYHTHFGIIEIDGASDPANLVIIGTNVETKDQVVVTVKGVHPDSIHTKIERVPAN